MKPITKAQLKAYLVQQYPNAHDRRHSILGWLVRYLCQHDGDLADHLNDITHHGCVSGVIGALIYNRECLAFYNRFEEELWTTVFDNVKNTGGSIGQCMDGFNLTIRDEVSFKVALVWFAVG